MDIVYRKDRRKWIVEVWSDDKSEPLVASGYNEPYPEEVYVKINDWCKETFGYHARTAYHIFEFKNKKHLDWFLIKFG